MPDTSIQNPFQRYAYSNTATKSDPNTTDYVPQNNLVVFSGGDLHAYINNRKVGNLESVTWSISVEVVGNYVMGRRDAVLYTTGKRVVVGSIVLSQYDRHALLEQVFNISGLGITTQGSLWNNDPALTLGGFPVNRETITAPGGVNTAQYIEADASKVSDAIRGSVSLTRGLSRSAFEVQLQQQLAETARIVGAQKFNYSDQLPPFDLTLVGVTKGGDAARCSLFGLQVTQETAGFSQNDLGNSVGMSFVALAVSPWRPVELTASQVLGN
jgi:hypothetical protein